MVADNDLGLIVQNSFRRHFVIADGEGEAGAAADDEAQDRFDALPRRAARTFGDQHTLPDFFIGTGLRQPAPIAVGEMDGLAGHRPFRRGGLGPACGAGQAKECGNGRADHHYANPGVCQRHRLPRNVCHLREL